MRLFYLILVLLPFILVGCRAENSKIKHPLTLERLFSSPSLNGSVPRGIQFSPDSKRVTYLKPKQEDQKILDLWEYNIAKNEHRLLVDSNDILKGQKEKLSEEEKANRERKRISKSGIISYIWNDQGKGLLFPLSGDLYYYDLEKKSVKQLTKTKSSELDPQFSPKGTFVSYVRDKNIFVYHLKKNLEQQLTFDGKGDIYNGLAEFVAQEEMRRYRGLWWSKSEKYIAYTQVDEANVLLEDRFEINADQINIIKQRYPYTGTENAKVKLGILPLTTKAKTKWVKFSLKEYYIPRVQWSPGKDFLYFQLQTRDQKNLSLYRVDPNKLSTQLILEENSKTWVNILGKARFLKKRNQFIWSSERSGFNHLYLYTNEGKLVKKLTDGNWEVSYLAGVNKDENILYFVGKKDSPLENHLYSLHLDKEGSLKKVTKKPGTHHATFSKDGSHYIAKFSSSLVPRQMNVSTSEGESLSWLAENKVNKNHPLGEYHADLVQPLYESFVNSDQVQIFYELILPKGSSSKKLPLLVYVYGGPGPQLVKNSWGWSRGLWKQLLAQKGYAVLTVDNRGSSGRGTQFEGAIYKRLGHVEVQDQKEAVESVIKKYNIDSHNVGVMGHSYGGYMVLMMMAKHPDTFKAGVSIAPVTDMSLYDTHYTERYLSTPKDNPEGYQLSSVLPIANNINGKLLLIHGMADDNVLFKNSTLLIKALQDRPFPFEMMLYPGAKHSLWGQSTQTHYHTSALNFLDRNLK